MAEKDDQIQIEETADGAAVVQVPDDFIPAEEGGEQTAAKTESDTDGEDADHPDDTEAVRAARRARRRAKKDLARRSVEEKDARLQELQRANRELNERLSRMEQRGMQYDIDRIDRSLEDANVRFEYAKMRLAEATQAGDGDAVAEAQGQWYEARQQLDQIANLKRQAQTQAAPQQRAPAPNPNVQRHAQEWMSRNSWYDPSSRDVDSKIAKQLDEALASEGFDPASPDYWDELDNRLQKYLPHRYTGAADSGQQTNRPRNVVGSSGREAAASAGGTSRNSFTLSPERVRAMKDAGAWDNPERRKHMIQKFMEYDRTHRS